MSTGGIAQGDILGKKTASSACSVKTAWPSCYEALHVRLRQGVAIKVLRDELASVPAIVERFEREGRALSTLRSQNFVRVQDVDVTTSGAPEPVTERAASLCRTQ